MTQPDVDDVFGKIAVIGMSGRYPGAANVAQFWQNLAEGRESISFYTNEELLDAGLPRELVENPRFVKALGAYDGTFLFDAPLFGYMPREAELLDPQQRVLMECAWESLEHAGYDPWRYPGRIGMFAGSGATQYLFELLAIPEYWNAANRFALLTYNDRDFLATQVGYKLNLRGPCITVQTACSTSLVAIVLACQSLLTFQSDIALAGGVTLDAHERGGHLYQEGGVSSVDGHCRAFDAAATGIVGGCGAGVVVLKRLQEALADHDTIHAVILGFGLNNDGAARAGFTAPGVTGQITVYSDAFAMAGVHAETIGFVECHGTGTPIGDPIEIAALTKAFRNHTEKRSFCAVGSVKTNIGHTGAAAGVAGFTKAVLAIQNKMIPPTLHFHTPNPQLDLEHSPFYVNSKMIEWPGGFPRRRAATTSLGAGGTNAHVILEESPSQTSTSIVHGYQLLVFSAKTPTALKNLQANMARHLEQKSRESLADAAYTLQVGRKVLPYRHFAVCHRDNAVSALNAAVNTNSVFRDNPAGPVAFLFPGQGAQYVNMAKELYAIEPVFREQVDLCAEILKPELKLDLRELLYPEPDFQEMARTRLSQTQYTQPALFVVEYALARTWMKWGLQPDCMIGHSIGEYAAACLADVFSLPTALRLVSVRGRLMQQSPGGAMTGIMLPAPDVHTLLLEHASVSLAAMNGPLACVISGPTKALAEVEHKLENKKVPYRRLHVGCAPHSSMMDSILPAFQRELENIQLTPPKLRYMSNFTGEWVKPSDVQRPEYWLRQLRDPVNFYQAARELLKTPRRIFLEVGPGNTLTSLITSYPERDAAHAGICSLPHPKHELQDSFAFMLNAAGQLWLEGCGFDWRSLHASESRRRIPLPTYPFERHYYRIFPTGRKTKGETHYPPFNSDGSGSEQQTRPERTVTISAGHDRPHLSSDFVRPRNPMEQTIAHVWENTLGIRELGIHDNFVELGGHSLVAIELARRVSESLVVPFTVEHLYETLTIAKSARLVAQLWAQNDAISASQPGSREASPIGTSITVANGQDKKTSAYLGLQAPLVTIRASGTRPPLFLVHPGGGGIKVYQQLAHYLDPKQPVYAFQCYVLGSHKAHPFISIEDMATHYIRHLRPVQPAGPYLLAGWSNGGVIAFEMAVQLQRMGEEVSMVGIFDAASRHHPEPEPGSAASRLAEDIIFTGRALAAREEKAFALRKEDLEHLPEHEQIEAFRQELQCKQIVPVEVDAPALRALLQTFNNTNQALESYIPGIYHGQVVVLRATDATPELRELVPDIYDDPSFGWQQYCTKRVDVRYVPGDHVHMAVEPNIQTLGSVLQKCIDELHPAMRM